MAASRAAPMDFEGYHATKPPGGIRPGLGRTGLGFFMTQDFSEAAGCFAEEDDVILELEGRFESPAYIDDLIREVPPQGYTPEELEAIAADAGLSVGQAAFRVEYGRPWNDELAAAAMARGHDALLCDGDPEWLAALNPGRLTIVRRLGLEGDPL